MGVAEHDFFKQFALLEEYVRTAAGAAAESGSGGAPTASSRHYEQQAP